MSVIKEMLMIKGKPVTVFTLEDLKDHLEPEIWDYIQSQVKVLEEKIAELQEEIEVREHNARVEKERYGQ
ncbi:hypothetical protein [Acetobacterium wieringae]|uniref:hypothetical protein n=1 Tax=Acetobacterium wieringae TaxID=52694 RepID=UPI0020338782|nr:hypothetical protein [Acetobacterium wieringae]URN83995.1 hypothetical protein CHL1_003163 [Acetobacterium wieringae]